MMAIVLLETRPEKIDQLNSFLFNLNGLHVAIEANKKVADFPDITLNLSNNIDQLYNKPYSSRTMLLTTLYCTGTGCQTILIVYYKLYHTQ